MKHTTPSTPNPREETLALLKRFARVYHPEAATAAAALLLKKKSALAC